MKASSHAGFWRDQVLIAYRGGCGEGPENTLETCRRTAAASPNTVLEIDTRVTHDGTPIAFHDGDTRRLCGTSARVRDLSWRGLSALRVQGERIPSISELAAAVPNPLLLDVRATSSVDLDAIAALIAQEPERFAVVSEHEWILRELTTRTPGILFGASWLRAVGALCSLPLPRSPIWMVPAFSALPRWFQRRARSDERVWAWTVSDVNVARSLLSSGVSGLFTKHPQRLGSALPSLVGD